MDIAHVRRDEVGMDIVVPLRPTMRPIRTYRPRTRTMRASGHEADITRPSTKRSATPTSRDGRLGGEGRKRKREKEARLAGWMVEAACWQRRRRRTFPALPPRASRRGVSAEGIDGPHRSYRRRENVARQRRHANHEKVMATRKPVTAAASWGHRLAVIFFAIPA